jgi:hypothetical protein
MRGDDHLLARAQRVGHDGLELLGVGHQVAVRQAAPLDSPVVPPVYCRNSRSSPFSSTGVRVSLAPCGERVGEGDGATQARIDRRAAAGWLHCRRPGRR